MAFVYQMQRLEAPPVQRLRSPMAEDADAPRSPRHQSIRSAIDMILRELDIAEDGAAYYRGAQMHPGEARRNECYDAARDLTERSDDPALYVEGWTWPRKATFSVPVPHAWFVDESGTVWDDSGVAADNWRFGYAVPASEFKRHVQTKAFRERFAFESMLPFLRARQELQAVPSKRSRVGDP